MRTPAGAIDVCGSVCRFVLTPTYCTTYCTTLPYTLCTAVVSGTVVLVHASYFYSRLHTTVI